MQHAQVMLAGDPAYGSPVIRPPSPASSIGTAYPADDTSLSDVELSQDAFDRKWTAKLRLDWPKDEELRKDDSPLISPPRNPAEEKLMYESILRGFRLRVQQLEEDAIFQRTLMRGSQVGLKQRPSSDNIDTLMQSMMTTTLGSGPNRTHNVSDGPWNRGSKSDSITKGN
ncbi:hypothetical protein BV22DRAFT_1064640 [Leucogyrophana mollusca]|uniref:Uncharacterized protein n=1 Tax=Leucogyrophana mollusca TaxID=85980 RepID=A0ACB8BLZ4_9AGAM|nr:hypothetical protein BV22DRAFT_1064640 [Leucogyrophana mollusca]